VQPLPVYSFAGGLMVQHSNSDLVMVLVLCLILLWNQVVPEDFCE